MQRPLAIALAVLACVALPAAPAQAATPLGAFEPPAVRLPDGGVLRGAFVAMEANGGAIGRFATLAVEGDLALEVDHAETDFSAGPAAALAPRTRTTREDIGAAQAFVVDPPPNAEGRYSLLVRTAPGGTASAVARLPDTRIAVPDDAAWTHPRWVTGPERPELTVPLGGSHELSPAGDVTLEVTGDLLVALYEVRLRVSSANGTWSTESGMVPGAGAVDAGGTVVGPADDRQAFLHVRSGRLTLRAPAADVVGLFVAAERAATPGPVEVEGSGALPGPASLAFGAPRDGRVPVEVAAVTPDELARLLEGRGDAPATVSASPWRGLRGPAALLAAAALGLAAWGLALSRRRALARAQVAFGAGRYDAAVRAAGSRLLAAPASAEATLVRAVSLLRLARPADAEAALAGRGARRMDAATREFLWACVRALQERPGDAAGHLARCLAADPAYRAEALANPWLRPLVPDASRRGRVAA